ncbi:PEP-CTERM sorting domain-containing protein [Gemmatimonas sp.]|uniref:PEP-CTERM sorting domain-containing protein n=1 Tax=Gemmatimonas sp. TaxID=1962908 RepID=UPI0035639005
MFAVPASAQLIQYTTTGFFTGGGGTPCNTALLGTGATCLYANGSGLQYNGSPVENVVNGGTSGFGSFQTMGLTQQSFAGNLFTMQIVQTSPTVGTSPNILGQITGSFSASAQGGSGGLVWTPNFNTFSVGAVNYRLFVDNTGGINIEPPRAGGVMGDPQTIRGNVSVVPEPGTYLLMASGLAGLGIMAGRRRRA